MSDSSNSTTPIDNSIQFRSEELFSVFYDAYLRYRSLHVRESSLLQAKTILNKHLTQWSALTVSQALSIERINGVYRSIVQNNSICRAWKNRIFGCLRSMLTYAFKTKRIEMSIYQDCLGIVDNIPENRSANKEKKIWSPKEEQKFLSVIKDNKHLIMFKLIIALGTRLSEFLGLTWDCFDGRRGTITIKQQLIHNSQKSFAISSILKSNESYRTCSIDSELKEALLTYKKDSGHTKGFIFRSPIDDSLPFSKANFRDLLKKYIRLSGVSKITPHSFRHARASKLLKACKNMLDVVAVARYMGHSPSMLMDTYSHCQENTIKGVLRRAGLYR